MDFFARFPILQFGMIKDSWKIVSIESNYLDFFDEKTWRIYWKSFAVTMREGVNCHAYMLQKIHIKEVIWLIKQFME